MNSAGQVQLHQPNSHQQYHQLHQLREENTRLLNQLLDLQHNYQDLLKQTLVDQRQQLQVLSASIVPPSPEIVVQGRGQGHGLGQGQIQAEQEPNAEDEELVKWLKDLNLADTSIQKVTS